MKSGLPRGSRIRHACQRRAEKRELSNDFDGLTIAVTHGSPWRYDTFVPVIFVGPGIAAQQVFREIATVDVAPTLSAILGISYPSGSVGKPLVEVLQTTPGGEAKNTKQ